MNTADAEAAQSLNHVAASATELATVHLLIEALNHLNAIFLRVFGLPIQYLDGLANLEALAAGLLAAAARGDWSYLFAIANCPKGSETLADPLAKKSSTLRGFCKSVHNFVLGIGAAALESAGLQQFLSGAVDLEPLHDLKLAMLGGDRMPHCPTNCSDAKQCRLCIDNANVAVVADCLVAAMTMTGFNVTLLALGKEGMRCAVGQHNLSRYKEKFGVYSTANNAASSTSAAPSAAAGLDRSLAILRCTDLLLQSALFPIL
jgi:hypothetical protein